MSRARTAFSKRGLPYEGVVDIDALSLRARYRVERVPVVIASASGQTQTAVFTQNATVKHNLGPVGIPSTLRGAYLSQGTLAAGGTLSCHLVAYDASANAEIVLTETINPEAATAREGLGFAIATTNVALAADDTIELHCTASDDTVTQDGKSLRVTLIWETTEETSPQR